jgi:hypothetical protein
MLKRVIEIPFGYNSNDSAIANNGLSRRPDAAGQAMKM